MPKLLTARFQQISNNPILYSTKVNNNYDLSQSLNENVMF